MTRTPLAELVRQRRERADLTQEQLAECSGVSRNTISAIEQGRIKIPQPAILRALVRILPLSMDECVEAMGFTEEEKKQSLLAEVDAINDDAEAFARLAASWWRERAAQRHRLHEPPKNQAEI